MVEGLRLSEVLRTNSKAIMKMAEVKVLKRFATTYCYNYPWSVQIEVTNNCNLRCKTCPRLEELDAKGNSVRDMDFDTFRAILENLKGLFWVYLCGRGEPLLNPEIYRMVEYAVGKKIPAVIVATNGTLLHGENARRLARARPRGVGVSIDSPDREAFRRIRNVDLDRIVSNIREFASLTDIPVGVTSVLNRENLENIVDMPELCGRAGAKYFRVLSMVEYDTAGVQSVRLSDFDEKLYLKLRSELRRRCKVHGIDLIMQAKFRDKHCHAPFNFANVDVDGNLTVCCALPNVYIGNVLDAGFGSLWNGKKMREWRKMLLRRVYPKKCVEISCSRINPSV